MNIRVAVPAPLNANFVPAVLWNKEYQRLVEESLSARDVSISICRPKGERWTYRTKVLPYGHALSEETEFYLDRLVKSLLWIYGGSRIEVGGVPEVIEHLREQYSHNGSRGFDVETISQTMFDLPIEVVETEYLCESSDVVNASSGYKRNTAKCAIGLDLGGTSIKCIARVDDEVVLTEQVSWIPYTESDPLYHVSKIKEAVALAASALPQVESIGISAAGLHYGEEPKLSALFQCVSKEGLNEIIQPLFQKLGEPYGGVPTILLNDGTAAALSGAEEVGCGGVMGISVGTSMAGGAVGENMEPDEHLNEFAFVPVDYSSDALYDEWGKDIGCGVDYCSQQAIAKLTRMTGLVTEEGLLPRAAMAVAHKGCSAGDVLATDIFKTVGVYLGYSIAHLSSFIPAKVVNLTGGVTSGLPGEVMLTEARRVIETEFPELHEKMQVQLANESLRSYGQAIAVSNIATRKGVLKNYQIITNDVK